MMVQTFGAPIFHGYCSNYFIEIFSDECDWRAVNHFLLVFGRAKILPKITYLRVWDFWQRCWLHLYDFFRHNIRMRVVFHCQLVSEVFHKKTMAIGSVNCCHTFQIWIAHCSTLQFGSGISFCVENFNTVCKMWQP